MAFGLMMKMVSVISVLVSRCLWAQTMLKCILSFIVFQCENSLCSSYVGKCQCIWQLREAETLPILLSCYTDTASAFITTYHLFSSVYMTDKTLSGTKKHHKSISISCLWNDEHDYLINIHPWCFLLFIALLLSSGWGSRSYASVGHLFFGLQLKF